MHKEVHKGACIRMHKEMHKRGTDRGLDRAGGGEQQHVDPRRHGVDEGLRQRVRRDVLLHAPLVEQPLERTHPLRAQSEVIRAIWCSGSA